MNYNWGDPKKNSRLTAIMMTKAEATRKKRLTNVRSTLSNQLHQATEQKLRRKKKRPESGQREVRREWNADVDVQHGQSNNDSHEFYPEQESQDSNPLPSQLENSSSSSSVSVSNNSSTASLEPIRQEVFPVPTLGSNNSKAPMFEEFGLNAAADGLFHPASTIEAFIEHDAKYHPEISRTSARSEKPGSGPRRARSGAEYPPSRESHKLPALHSGKAKRERLSSKSESKLQLAGSHGSAPASSQLLGIADTSVKRSLSTTQSDTSLYAPRRLDIVPSSADCNALDIYEHEADSDDTSAPCSPAAEPTVMITEHTNALVKGDCDSTVPPLDFSLTRKFEELKRIMKSNREKSRSARHDQHTDSGSTASSAMPFNQTSSQAKVESASRVAAEDPSKTRGRKKSSQVAKSAGGASLSGPSGGKGPAAASSSSPTSSTRTTTKRFPPSAAADSSASTNTSAVRAKRTVMKTSSSSATKLALKKDVKSRNGVSLADLKEEHRAALEMLKELGGPVDADYQQQDVDVKAPSKALRSSRSRKHGIPSSGLSRSRLTVQQTSSARTSSGELASPHNQQRIHDSHTSSPSSTPSSGRLVAKLRASVFSGRENDTEAVPETNSPVETIDSPTLSTRQKQGEPKETKHESAIGNNAELDSPFGIQSLPVIQTDEGQMVSTVGLLQNDRPLTDVEEAEDEDEEDEEQGRDLEVYSEAGNKDESGKRSHKDACSSHHRVGSSGEGELEVTKTTPTTARSGDRYSDEDFEADW